MTTHLPFSAVPSARTGLALSLLLATGLALSAAPATAQEPAPIEAGVRAPDGKYANDGLDALHYDVELAVSDAADWFWGRTRIRLRADRDGVEAARLDFTGLEVLGREVVRTTSEGASGSRMEGGSDDLEDGLLTVPFDEPLRAGDEVDITVEYRGVPDDGLLIRDNIEGTPAAFVDNWPNRTRFWMPSLDHPSDKATVRFTIHAPAAWEVIANGRLVGQPIPVTAAPAHWPPADRYRTWRYVTDVPHPTYTMVIGGTVMEVDTLGLAACGLAPASPRPDGCVEVTQWLYPGSVESGSPSFVRAVEMVDFFAELIGPFPYEKLAHVQSSTRFGGMENSSAIFYSEQGLAAGRDMEGTVSHETAHQWFGDSVTETDWGHLWLSEGFATYFGALFFEYADGVEAFRERIRGTADAYLNSPDTLRPVVDTETGNLFGLLNRNSYQKGGMVLHMLRKLIGDDAFFRGIREYYARHRDATALTDDFRAVMEEVSGQDLGWFFEQWLHRPGYPVVRVSTRAGIEGGLQLDLRQIQGAYAPRFRLPMTVEFRTGNGDPVRREIVLEGEAGSWYFPAIDPAAEVVLDPDGEVLMRSVPARAGGPAR